MTFVFFFSGQIGWLSHPLIITLVMVLLDPVKTTVDSYTTTNNTKKVDIRNTSEKKRLYSLKRKSGDYRLLILF